MTWDPTRRTGGSWPGDRPVRWPGVARGLAWLALGSAAGLAQLLLVVPLLAVAGGRPGEALGGAAGVLLALAWGGLTLYAAWSWLFGRWRLLAIPVITAALLWVASGLA